MKVFIEEKTHAIIIDYTIDSNQKGWESPAKIRLKSVMIKFWSQVFSDVFGVTPVAGS
jgi:hypothetical protein